MINEWISLKMIYEKYEWHIVELHWKKLPKTLQFKHKMTLIRNISSFGYSNSFRKNITKSFHLKMVFLKRNCKTKGEAQKISSGKKFNVHVIQYQTCTDIYRNIENSNELDILTEQKAKLTELLPKRMFKINNWNNNWRYTIAYTFTNHSN